MAAVAAPSLRDRVESANAEAVGRLLAADPVLVDVVAAGDVVEGLEGRKILHSGPPIDWAQMCGAQRGSVLGLIVFEGWADTIEEAERLAASGAITFEPNHHHHGVGPMAGTTSPSLPVWVVENRAFGNRAYCRPTDAAQQFGDYSEQALDGIRSWRDVRAPSVAAALQRMGGLPLKQLFARALAMGDELHNRPNAMSSLVANALAADLVQAGLDEQALAGTLTWLRYDEFFGLAISMAAAKASVEPAEGVEASTLVTAMARNGTEFGFHGCFHEVRPDRIVQTFTWEGEPDGVALETLTFEDLGDGRTRLRTQSLCDSFEGRDAWLRSGMEVGVDQGYAKLDSLLADGQIAGTTQGALA